MTGLCRQRLINIRRSDSTTEAQSQFLNNGTLDSNLVRPVLLPSHLRLPALKWDPNLCFLNMIAHVSTIGLHQQALAKVGPGSLHPDALRESERIRVESAIEVASIMRASCHVDLAAVSAPSADYLSSYTDHSSYQRLIRLLPSACTWPRRHSNERKASNLMSIRRIRSNSFSWL